MAYSFADSYANLPLTRKKFEEFCGELPEVVPVKIDRETGWCPSCQRIHTQEEWEEIMTGQEAGEWVWA